MTHVVHLRIKAAGETASVAYSVERSFVRESGVEHKEPKDIDMPLALTDPGGPQALWESVRELVAEDLGEGEDPGSLMLRLHEPELRAVDWEALARETALAEDRAVPRVLRTTAGPGSFQSGGPLSFGDLPVRVLVVGVDSHVERGAADDPPWHEDVAVHDAVHAHAERWEVDVLPGPVSHSVLAETVKASKPQVLHLAGSAARTLFKEGAHELGGLNLSPVRLVVSSNDEARDEAHRLLEPYARADALTPVPAVISLTPAPESDPEHDLCASLTRLYGALIDGESLDVAVRSATKDDSSVSAAVTVNCRPDLVLPKASAPPPPSPADLYGSLERATDRVGQRRTALEQMESGADVSQLIVLSGGEPDDKMGTTWFLLSTMRVWEERPGARALYLDFGRLGSTKPPRAAQDMPQADDVVLETVALLTEGVRTHSDRQGGWHIDGELADVEALVARERLNVQGDGGYHTGVSPVRDELVGAAMELLVKAAPPDTHLVLALDHFVENEKVRPVARYLVKKLFKPALHSHSAITVVATARNPHHDRTDDLLAGFVVERNDVTLQRWSAHHGGPLLRELGTRMGYDWHDMPEWRALVREKLGTIAEDFGPQLLKDVCDTALARLG
ncbi:CHAT domain-containing protein [Streptomyces cinnabarinus]|uniref:CHAT domain-containing protein n=1 Tax=Streptomyces cinnabarinus TaxID=67287 RepID=A0ABY7KQ82_9ACTN|nr:hypothetical protein [Streptomyces cinnabarinus]WAZ25039.1 CHAT domain-containing protein [Streptomyces cinnabarinus]